jgi:flagellar P-ring protein precursor FlgI
MARLEPLPVSMGGQARIVINERTGTVVVGNEVRLGRTAVAHGNLSPSRKAPASTRSSAP